MVVGSSLYTITNKLSISDCQALGFGMSFRWWSPCLDSDLSPRSCGGRLRAGGASGPPAARVRWWLDCMPGFDAACLIKHYRANLQNHYELC